VAGIYYRQFVLARCHHVLLAATSSCRADSSPLVVVCVLVLAVSCSIWHLCGYSTPMLFAGLIYRVCWL
jgi:hypothetical protein